MKIYYMSLDLGVKVTQNFAQYPPNHMTYASAKFDVVSCNGLGGERTLFDFDLVVKVTQNVAQ